MTTSLTLMRCHGCWHPKPAARAQKRTVGPLGIFPPKVMQHPRRHPSLCTLLAALASGDGIVKAFPLGTPTYPHGDSTLGLFQPGSLPRMGVRDRKLPAASQSHPAGKVAAHGGTSWGRGGHGDRVSGCTPSAPQSDGGAPGAAQPRCCRHHTHRRPRTGTLLARSRSRAPQAQKAPLREGKVLPVFGRTD